MHSIGALWKVSSERQSNILTDDAPFRLILIDDIQLEHDLKS